ncbi:MAG: purine-nucleoside phosphorylase [Candidatus Hydrogenedentes bacterium]|nr:purine-nucleoside phosphorylase [Candidatus Hydrogenedentota bacterium]
MSELKRSINEAVRAIRKASKAKPKIGIVLGTGLGGLADRMKVTARISYDDIPHFPESTVDTHAGDLVIGTLGGKEVVALSGRYHYYEGHSLQEVTFPIRVAKALGIETLIVSNASGGLNPQFAAGDLMLITDHINFMGDNPLIGPNDDSLGPRFPDMIEPYTNKLIELAESVALAKGVKLLRGVYLGCLGPCLETRAEYRLMRIAGADCVGMSTVPEVIVAVHAGLKVLGFSAITDECLPDALKPAKIEEIIATANALEPVLSDLVVECIKRMK